MAEFGRETGLCGAPFRFLSHRHAREREARSGRLLVRRPNASAEG